jgi:putative endonuclease
MLFARDKGTEVETAVCRYLQQQGLKLLTRNYHSRGGEIDLIMQHGNVLVFVEVRFRRSAAFGSAAESVTRTKQLRLIHTAEQYLQRHRVQHDSCRFDVVGVSLADDGYRMQWIQNAFEQGS